MNFEIDHVLTIYLISLGLVNRGPCIVRVANAVSVIRQVRLFLVENLLKIVSRLFSRYIALRYFDFNY